MKTGEPLEGFKLYALAMITSTWHLFDSIRVLAIQSDTCCCLTMMKAGGGKE